MTRQELRVYLSTWFCACGSPEAACGALLRLLRLHPLYDHRQEFEAWVSDIGIEHLLLYVLDREELTEHGGAVGGAWLTTKGEAVRDALAREEADCFEALLNSECSIPKLVRGPAGASFGPLTLAVFDEFHFHPGGVGD